MTSLETEKLAKLDKLERMLLPNEPGEWIKYDEVEKIFKRSQEKNEEEKKKRKQHKAIIKESISEIDSDTLACMMLDNFQKDEIFHFVVDCNMWKDFLAAEKK